MYTHLFLICIHTHIRAHFYFSCPESCAPQLRGGTVLLQYLYFVYIHTPCSPSFSCLESCTPQLQGGIVLLHSRGAPPQLAHFRLTLSMCVPVGMFVLICIDTYTCLNVCMYVFMYMPAYVCVYACMFASV